jgi:hypothetical protein
MVQSCAAHTNSFNGHSYAPVFCLQIYQEDRNMKIPRNTHPQVSFKHGSPDEELKEELGVQFLKLDEVQLDLPKYILLAPTPMA